MSNTLKLILSILGCQLASIFGALATMSSVNSWYQTLNKPFFNPPDWLFGPVWFLLYCAIGAAWYLIWKEGWAKKEVRTAGYFFLIQLILNVLWSFSFFGLRSPFLGLINIVLLLAVIVVTMKKFKLISKAAFYLFIPYLLWVSFAAILNTAIWILN